MMKSDQIDSAPDLGRPTPASRAGRGPSRRDWMTGVAGLSLLPRQAAGASRRLPWPGGRPTPELALRQLSGESWTLASLRGKVVMLNFWASWCEPCRQEMPALQTLAQSHTARGLAVVAVNFKETADTIRLFTQQLPLTLPIVLDRQGEAARDWGVRLFPTTILLGRDGRARSVIQGEEDWLSPPALRWITDLL